MVSKKLPRSFYLNDVVKVAEELLGHILVIKQGNQYKRYKIVETESYCGLCDRASHAFYKKRTKRTEVMFEEGGKLYVYLIYGMYYCLNIVTEKKGIPQAVLIRAVEPLDEGEIKYKKEMKTNGPGKLCKHLNIDKHFNGLDLVASDELFIIEGKEPTEKVRSKRINIDYSAEAKDFKWRFFIKNNRFVSR